MLDKTEAEPTKQKSRLALGYSLRLETETCLPLPISSLLNVRSLSSGVLSRNRLLVLNSFGVPGVLRVPQYDVKYAGKVSRCTLSCLLEGLICEIKFSAPNTSSRIIQNQQDSYTVHIVITYLDKYASVVPQKRSGQVQPVTEVRKVGVYSKLPSVTKCSYGFRIL